MQNLLGKIKAFNNKHRNVAPFLIWIEIVLIVLASIIKNVCRHYKILLAGAIVLLVIGISAKYLTAAKKMPSVETPISGVTVEDEAVAEISNAAAMSEASYAYSQIADVQDADIATTLESSDDLAHVEITEAAATAESSEPAYVDSGISQFMETHPEAVGWIRFEDDLISSPLMQADDNSKYALKDADGNDSAAGAIFLDYRSSADFSDSNTIIYGHNMRDRSMFGALKIYKENLEFLDEHKYFQIITPEGSSRYMIFAFMDVPKNSYIYDVCGDNISRMREFLDTIEYKTYIDTGIEPTVDDKIITLSTCTQKDDLFFVMFAVKVDE
ncbi:sortase B [Butyrivibrio proteoclasticus]|uniref:Sortase B n=1 Tax=Butyrivibrio proteoclasticus TaxID=43305 RepID=A0A1I5STB5_9FIRM|nr:class B sortase [Butyrivibrio proteoclasticus]SFP73983.1 sortase B [Butyrivibrio proteoclasticus]